MGNQCLYDEIDEGKVLEEIKIIFNEQCSMLNVQVKNELNQLFYVTYALCMVAKKMNSTNFSM